MQFGKVGDTSLLSSIGPVLAKLTAFLSSYHVLMSVTVYREAKLFA